MTLQQHGHSRTDAFGLAAGVYGAYYALTGVFPLLAPGTFQRITGPKADMWLVKTVGPLVTAIGASVAWGAARRGPQPEMLLLALGSAASLAFVDVFYALRGRISRVYLADAVAQACLATGLLVGAAQPRRRRSLPMLRINR